MVALFRRKPVLRKSPNSDWQVNRTKDIERWKMHFHLSLIVL